MTYCSCKLEGYKRITGHPPISRPSPINCDNLSNMEKQYIFISSNQIQHFCSFAILFIRYYHPNTWHVHHGHSECAPYLHQLAVLYFFYKRRIKAFITTSFSFIHKDSGHEKKLRKWHHHLKLF